MRLIPIPPASRKNQASPFSNTSAAFSRLALTGLKVIDALPAPAGSNRVEPPFYRLAGGTIPFMRKYSTICP
jgi:hypothetical protein